MWFRVPLVSDVVAAPDVDAGVRVRMNRHGFVCPHRSTVVSMDGDPIGGGHGGVATTVCHDLTAHTSTGVAVGVDLGGAEHSPRRVVVGVDGPTWFTVHGCLGPCGCCNGAMSPVSHGCGPVNPLLVVGCVQRVVRRGYEGKRPCGPIDAHPLGLACAPGRGTNHGAGHESTRTGPYHALSFGTRADSFTCHQRRCRVEYGSARWTRPTDSGFRLTVGRVHRVRVPPWPRHVLGLHCLPNQSGTAPVPVPPPPISGQPALSGDGHVRLWLRSEKPCVVPAPVPLKETRLHRLGPGSPVTSTPCTPCGEWLDLDRLAMWGDEPRNRRWTHARFHLRFQPRLRLSEPTSMWEWFGSPPREEVCSGSLGEPVRVHHLHPRHDSARPLGVEP